MSSKYSKLADEFIARIRAAKLTGTSDVALIFHFCDANGKTSRRRESIIPTTVIALPTTPQAVRTLASTRHIDAIIASIESRVRNPAESTILDGVPVKLVNIELAIEDAFCQG